MCKKLDLSTRTTTTGNYLIPRHQIHKLSTFEEIGKNEFVGIGVGGDIRAKAKAELYEIQQVLVPEYPKEVSKKDREKIEKEANKIVRLRYCPRPEYYQVPPWIKKKKLFKMYFIERLAMEIKLRDGYVCRDAK